jgi:ubiquinone/menaquinone biosynthesis C-methylase UbiE
MAGWIMAHRESNLRRNQWAVSELDIEPDLRVLELGCGPGVALAHAVERVSTGRVVGVDHSELMVRMAARRSAKALADGRLELVHGTAEMLAERGEVFDRVLAVNVVQFLDAPAKTLRMLRGIMSPDGLIGVVFQPRNRGATDEDAERGAERIQELLKEAGFHDLRVESLELKPRVVCVLGRV